VACLFIVGGSVMAPCIFKVLILDCLLNKGRDT
jgi:hypothetical protein